MSGADLFADARWIWSSSDNDSWNRWVLFRKSFSAEAAAGGAAGSSAGAADRLTLHVAADAHYRLWVNGEPRSEGPARSWPDELFFDTVDLTDAAVNTRSLDIEILVRHFRPGTGAYAGGEPGCAAVLTRKVRSRSGEEIIAFTDGTWECADHPGYREPVTKMSNGMSYAEVYRADETERGPAWDWRPAADDGPAITDTRRIISRDIPPLADEILRPAAVVRRRRVKTPGFFRSVNLRPLVFPNDRDVNKHKRFSGILAVGIRSERETAAEIGLTVDPHDTDPVAFLVGGAEFLHENGRRRIVNLKKGSNLLRVLVSGEYHDPTFHFHFVLPEGAVLKHPFEESDAETPFVFLGPLARASRVQAGDPIPPAAKDVIPVSLLKTLNLNTLDSANTAALRIAPSTEAALRTVPFDCVSPHHVALECMAAETVATGGGEREARTKGASLPHTVSLDATADAEIIWDFGREVSGFLEFEIDAAPGTVADFFCFESLHDDGLIEHTYSLNNSLRYVCGTGGRKYASFLRRGFRYVMTVFRGGTGRVSLRDFSVRESLYPTPEKAFFEASDPRLGEIWRLSEKTVALCMEDTYVDCPAYEQTYWTGDARNTALYSYYLFRAAPLFLRCARLAARSLERSTLIESHVPSSWRNIIPSWSFFHVIAGTEYLFYADDESGFRNIYPSLVLTMENAAALRVEMGDGTHLFAMHAWNMVDWAPMDVRDDGIIAHQNAQFVLACRELAKAAEEIGETDTAGRLEEWAAEVADGFRRWFWSEETGAYRDSLTRDGAPSGVFSVQTQLFAFMAGIDEGPRKRRLENLIKDPPPPFVEIASPFVQHFLFEVLARFGDFQTILGEIRRVWGNMLDHGATTCWEGWSLIPGHYTRSHCHAWSAAPAFFLPTIVLGVRPRSRGFRSVVVAPFPCDLTSAKGSVPTPLGPIDVSWTIAGGLFSIAIRHPAGMTVEFVPPPGTEPGAVSIGLTAGNE